jgi:hypothetical protein
VGLRMSNRAERSSQDQTAHSGRALQAREGFVMSRPQHTDSDAEVKSRSKGRGYYRLSRCMREHPIVGYHLGAPEPADKRRCAYAYGFAWQFLIEEAAYRPRTKVVYGTSYQLNVGELVGSERFLAEAWNWHRTTVRRFLKKLCAHEMIKVCPQKGRKAGTIVLCNYAEYQQLQEHDVPASVPAEVQKCALTRKKDNTVKEKKDPLSSSDDLLPFVADADKVNPPKPDTRTKASDPVAAELSEVAVAFKRWNEVARECGFQKANRLTPERKKKLTALLKDGGLETFERALSEMTKSKFLRGENDRGWRAHIDFLFERGKYDKILDGNYSFGGKSQSQQGQRHFGLPVFK